jgi:hypothetical protein
MRGAVTAPHQDFYVNPQLLFHISGIKIWLLWPQNEHNRTHFRKSLLLAEEEVLGGQVPHAIEVLTEMQVLVVDKARTTFIVPMGMYHACVSITNCVHSGSKTVDLEQLERLAFVVNDWATDFRRAFRHTIAGLDDTFFLTELTESPAPNSMLVHFLHWVGCVRRLGRGGVKYRRHIEAAAHNLGKVWETDGLENNGLRGTAEQKAVFLKRKEILKCVARRDWSSWTF